MPLMRKLIWSKLKSPFTSSGQSEKEQPSSLNDQLSLSEEYKKAFRTRSYEDLRSRVQVEIRRTYSDNARRSIELIDSSSCLNGVDKLLSSTSVPLFIHLMDHLLEPQKQETFVELMRTLRFHNLLVEYFCSTVEACNICELLLHCIYRSHANYGRIKRIIKLSKRAVDNSAGSDNEICEVIAEELAAYALLRNPLVSFVNLAKYRHLHETNILLLNRLRLEKRKIIRRVKVKRICKRISKYRRINLHTARHLPRCLSSASTKKLNLIHGTSFLESLCTQLDLATKGTYILINDFDTMRGLVRRLYDEIEHRKALANTCLKNGKSELLKEVIKEFCLHDSPYLEKIEELERHVYLCFHTINRCRKLVLRETADVQP